MGGMSAKSFMEYAKGYGVTLTLGQAEELRDTWFATWLEMQGYFNWISDQLGPMGGRIFQEGSGRVRGDVRFTEAANGYVQGLAADGAKDAVWRVQRECFTDKSSPLYGSRVVIFLYDEMILEVPIANSAAAAARLSTVMREEMQRWLPQIPVLCSPVLMKRWFKGAKPSHVNGGNCTVQTNP